MSIFDQPPQPPPLPQQESSDNTTERRQEVLNSFLKLREDIISAYRTIPDIAEIDPFAIDETDPNIKQAKILEISWYEIADLISTWEDNDLRYRINLQKTMLYADAGFRDVGYLSRVLGELYEDSADIEKNDKSPVRIKTRQQINLAIKKIRALLQNHENEEIKYDLSDIDIEKKGDEKNKPKINLIEELRRANESALRENSEYKTSPDGPTLVWKHMPDEAKAVWNYQIWNPKYLIDPDTIEMWAKIRGTNVYSAPLVKKKIKINRPT